MNGEIHDAGDGHFIDYTAETSDIYDGGIEDDLLLVNDEKPGSEGYDGDIDDDSEREAWAPATSGTDAADDIRAAAREAGAWQLHAMLQVQEVEPVTAADIPVQVPSPAELDVRGELAAADPPTRIRRMTELLPDVRARLMDHPRPAVAAGYQACELEHGTLQHRSRAALASLIEDTRATFTPGDDTTGPHWQSLHMGEYAVEGGETVSVTRSLTVRMIGTRLYDESERSPAITVETHDGKMLGLSRFGVAAGDAGTLFRPVMINAADAQVPDMERTASELSVDIRYEAWGAGVQPWVEQYRALPQPTVPVPPDEDFGLPFIPAEVHRFLAGQDVDDAMALQTLRGVYGGEHAYAGELGATIDETLEALAVESGTVEAALYRMELYGVTERYEWLLAHAEEIHTAAMDAERAALEMDFEPAYSAWHDRTEQHISRVEQLAQDLGRMHSTTQELPEYTIDLPEPPPHIQKILADRQAKLDRLPPLMRKAVKTWQERRP